MNDSQTKAQRQISWWDAVNGMMLGSLLTFGILYALGKVKLRR
jgi:hypothetical protein